MTTTQSGKSPWPTHPKRAFLKTVPVRDSEMRRVGVEVSVVADDQEMFFRKVVWQGFPRPAYEWRLRRIMERARRVAIELN